jgi:hypothetical protein
MGVFLLHQSSRRQQGNHNPALREWSVLEKPIFVFFSRLRLWNKPPVWAAIRRADCWAMTRHICRKRNNPPTVDCKEFCMKKFVVFVLCVCAAFALFGQSAGDFTTRVNTDGTITITGYKGSVKAVVIPETIDGRRVTAIGDWTFYNNRLTSVTLPNSVTIIGNMAFADNQLTGVIFPNSVTSIGYGAFGDNQLTSVTIPDSVTSIGAGAFSSNQLTSVTLPNRITTIEDSVFLKNRLSSVTIPTGVTSIGKFAFNGNGLSSVTIPNSVTTIGEEAFGDNQFTSVTIPNSVITIGDGAFRTLKLTSVTIGANVNLGKNSFLDGFIAYYDTQRKQAGTYVLRDGAWSRQDQGGGTILAGDFEITVNTDGTVTISKYTGSVNAVVIPETIDGRRVTAIGRMAFQNNQLTSVIIPNGVTIIGDGAFWTCRALTSVTIPNSVTTIGEGAFYFCRGLTSITIPNSVTTIGQGAFADCNGLSAASREAILRRFGETVFLGWR